MKISISLKPLSVFAAFVFFLGCSNDTPVSSRFDLVGNNEVGEILQAENAAQADTTAGKILSNGASTRLLLGLFNNTQSKILMRFASFPKGVSVRTASLILPTHRVLGTGADFEATAHRIVSDWNDSTVTNENFGNAFDPLVAGRQMIAAVDTDSVVIALDQSLVSGWMDSSIANYGVLVQAPGAGFAKQFYSRNNSAPAPILRLEYSNNGVDSTKSISVSKDAFIFEFLQPPPSGPLYVSNGTDYRTLVKFDLTNYPSNATINRAQLILTVDVENTHITPDLLNVYLLGIGKNSFDPLAAVEDSTFLISLQSVTDSTATVVFEMRSVVQNWLRQVDDSSHLNNFGIAVVGQTPVLDLQQLAIHSKESNPALAPKLKIDYTLPPRVQ
jgi:hypothetical protein